MDDGVDANRVRIFVGCDSNDCDLEQMMVLEYSLRKHATLTLDISWMRLSTQSVSPWYSAPSTAEGWRTQHWATPFSGFRWAIPALCHYQGRAIYMDTDILALGDIAELWRAPIVEPAVVLAKPEQRSFRFCVSLWDCARARPHLPPIEALQSAPEAHARCGRYFASHPELVGAIDPAYNCVDGEGIGVEHIRMLHYSDMATQFSHRHAWPRLAREGKTHWFDGKLLPHPRRDLETLFERHLQEAYATGRTLDDYRNPHPVGALRKKSERRYKGNPVTRPGLRKLWGWTPGRGLWD